jgi:hypothetical protein
MQMPCRGLGTFAEWVMSLAKLHNAEQHMLLLLLLPLLLQFLF